MFLFVEILYPTLKRSDCSEANGAAAVPAGAAGRLHVFRCVSCVCRVALYYSTELSSVSK